MRPACRAARAACVLRGSADKSQGVCHAHQWEVSQRKRDGCIVQHESRAARRAANAVNRAPLALKPKQVWRRSSRPAAFRVQRRDDPPRLVTALHSCCSALLSPDTRVHCLGGGGDTRQRHPDGSSGARCTPTIRGALASRAAQHLRASSEPVSSATRQASR